MRMNNDNVSGYCCQESVQGVQCLDTGCTTVNSSMVHSVQSVQCRLRWLAGRVSEDEKVCDDDRMWPSVVTRVVEHAESHSLTGVGDSVAGVTESEPSEWVSVVSELESSGEWRQWLGCLIHLLLIKPSIYVLKVRNCGNYLKRKVEVRAEECLEWGDCGELFVLVEFN